MYYILILMPMQNAQDLYTGYLRSYLPLIINWFIDWLIDSFIHHICMYWASIKCALSNPCNVLRICLYWWKKWVMIMIEYYHISVRISQRCMEMDFCRWKSDKNWKQYLKARYQDIVRGLKSWLIFGYLSSVCAGWYRFWIYARREKQ